MSDSDADFEKFLQESLSSSSASYQSFLSELSRSRGVGGDAGRQGSLPRQWWVSDGSDQELEMAGQSWLKSSTTRSGTGRPTVQLTLPSAAGGVDRAAESNEYTRDSLEGGGGVRKDAESLPSTKTSSPSEGDFQDTFSLLSGKTSVLSASVLEPSPLPGLDTLEEGEDKKRFFADLEGSRGSPLDYSELNRQLGETGQSSLTFNATAVGHPKPPAVTRPLEDPDKTPVPSDNEGEEVSLPPSAIHATPSSLHTSCTTTPHPPTHGHKTELSTTTDLHASATSMRSGSAPEHQNAKLSRGRPDKQRGVTVLPVHKGTDQDSSTKSYKSDSSSHSADTTGDLQSTLSEHREFLLSPIHTTELTASGHFKKFTAKEQKSEKFQQPSCKADAIALSPIHVKVPDTDGSKSRNQTSSLKSKVEHKDVGALRLSPIHAPVHKKDSEEVAVHTMDVGHHHHSKKVIQSHMPSADPSDHPLVSSLRMKSKVPTKDSEKTSDKKRNDSYMSPQTSATEIVLKIPATSDAQSNTFLGVSVTKGQQDSLTTLTESGVQFSESGLERDLAELQSALEAAGLPKLGGEDEQHEQVQHAADLQSDERVKEVSDTQQSTWQESTRMPGGSEGKGGVGGTSIEDMIRAITASELASLTKEILLQDLEKGDTATPEPGHIKPPESPPEHLAVKQKQGRSQTHVEPSTKALPLHLTTTDSEDGETSMEASESFGTDHVVHVPLSEPHKRKSPDQAGFDLSPIHVAGNNGLLKHLELSRTNSGMREKRTATKKQGGGRERGARFSGNQLTTSVRKTPSASTAVAHSTQSKMIMVPPAVSTGAKVTPRSSVKSPGFSKLALSSGHILPGTKSPLSSRRVPSSGRVRRTKPGREEELEVSRPPVKGETHSVRTRSASSRMKGGAVETSANEKEPTSVVVKLHESHLNSEGEPKLGEDITPSLDQELRAEVARWQLAWQEEKTRYESLAVQLANKERGEGDGRIRQEDEEREREEHSKEVEELRGEVFALNAKLRKLESLRQQLSQGGEVAPLTREEQSVLQKEIQEQEMLLQGYQKENERLCHELAMSCKELKSVKTQLYQDNQKLTAELMNTRSQLERQSHQLHQARMATPLLREEKGEGGIEETRTRIFQLEGMLEEVQEKCRGLESQVKQLKHSVHCYEGEVRDLKQQRREAEQRMAVMVGKEEVLVLRDKHKEEVNDLHGKLQWYAENQRLLDQECQALREKDQEIAALREKVASLQSSAPQRVKGRAGEAKRVQQLERQVKELEEVIRKRFPNSLSALILTSGAVTEEKGEIRQGTRESVSGGVAAPPPSSHQKLQSRIKQLEHDLECREEESGKRIRALQQKYSNMEILYEQQISYLKDQLEHLSGPSPLPPPTATPADHQMEGVQCRGRKGRGEEEEEREESQSEEKVHSLQLQLRELQEHDTQLSAENTKLQSELDQMRRGGEGRGGRDYLATEWQRKEVEEENRILKEKLSTLHFELAHQRVLLQGRLAEVEGRTRQLKEEADEKISQLQEEHRSKIDSLVAKFARDHAESEATTLRSKVSAMEATIVHLKEQLETSQVDAELLSASRAREERLAQQLKTLTEELMEAKKYHTPEMQHFRALLAKISSLEARTLEYESRMRERWQLGQNLSQEQLKELEHKWRKQMSAKNAEIQQFREELDYLLSTLDVLQHGTVAS